MMHKEVICLIYSLKNILTILLIKMWWLITIRLENRLKRLRNNKRKKNNSKKKLKKKKKRND
jgi:hypothetical protein